MVCNRGALVEVKNKKGNSPLWLAANGGHLNVVELLYNAGADIDSQDNRKVSLYWMKGTCNYREASNSINCTLIKTASADKDLLYVHFY